MKKQKSRFSFTVISLIVVAALGVLAGTVSAKDINGFYVGNGGGAYFIRQVGTKIYWVGEDAKGAWANVFVGTVNGTKVTGRWWDIPKGKAQTSGEITFEIKGGGNSLVKVSSSATFVSNAINLGPADITEGPVKISHEANALAALRSNPEGFRGGNNNLTGAWSGDDYATYYVREMPNGDVVWFGENNLWGDPGGEERPSFARVFIGKKVGGLITGDWVDVPKGKAIGKGVLGSRLVNQQEIKFNTPPVGIDGSGMERSLPNNLRGFADLHAHPMVNLAFGGKFIHGGPDVGSLLPADSKCNPNVRAKSISQALGNDKSTHGGPGLENPCGDMFRAGILHIFQDMKKGVVTPDNATGYPSFKDYPKWNDLTHQKMWVDWIRRSYNGGQRVMVALATHNATLAAAVSGPGDGPTDDAASADLQVKEIKAFVARHSDFMEVAFTPADLRRIVAANKMAIVLGVEIDNIGNFNKMLKGAVIQPLVDAEINRLHKSGVRYIFPVHVLDNAFGHTAVYESLFNYSGRRENGTWWGLECAKKEDMITYKFEPLLGTGGRGIKDLLGGLSGIKVKLDLNTPDLKQLDGCATGHRNNDGLKALGGNAIKSMWKLGMLVDVDHMSEYGVEETLALAEGVPGGFPVVSGHTGLRLYAHSENNRTLGQLERIGKLGGMFGLGSDNVPADKWAAQYVVAADYINGSKGKGPNTNEGRIAFGTDLNGLVKGAPPRAGANIYKNGFSKSSTGDKTWDYRKEGVAHYGMLPDFREDIRTEPNHGERVFSTLMRNAEMFARMWEKAEKMKGQVK